MTRVECQNCNWNGDAEDCRPIEDVSDRVDPGEIMPYGECPECGSLCHKADIAGPFIFTEQEYQQLRRLLMEPLGEACQYGSVSRSIARKLFMEELVPDDEPETCAECGCDNCFQLLGVDVNGTDREAWVCDNCGYAHLLK